jgi:hypothetical protein
MIRRSVVLASVAALLVVVAPAAPLVEEPSRESLLAAWEARLRDDPQTLVFEKLEDSRYRWSTERFPFDGVVRVLNLVVDDRTFEYAASGVVGVVETDLEGVSDEFRRQYAYSIGLWQGANTLYFDADTGEWQSANEWQSSLAEQYSVGGGGWLAWLSGWMWVIFLAIMVLVVFWLSRRASSQMKKAMAAQDTALAEQERAIRLTEDAIEISRDSNRVLKEIRDLLKER